MEESFFVYTLRDDQLATGPPKRKTTTLTGQTNYSNNKNNKPSNNNILLSNVLIKCEIARKGDDVGSKVGLH